MRFSSVLPLLPALLAAAPAHAQSASSISVSVFSALSSQTGSASAASASATASSTGSAAPQQTPGFVNNGTVGMYPCAGGNPDSLTTPRSNRTDAAMPANSSSSAAASSSDASGAPQLVMNSTSSTSRLYALGVDYGSCPEAQAPAYPTQPLHLRAPDDSLRATFSPYGAGITELWVKDRAGTFRDVVLGFDNITNYLTDPLHPNFGPIVGRYANRIQNGTYSIDGVTYHAPLNENNVSTLHGGAVGYDRSPFEIVSLNASAVTFALTDPDGNQGFPGTVRSHISYALRAGGVWSIAMNATVSEKKSPIMLSSHVYWNLDGYRRDDNETTILDHVLHLPQADKYIETDSLLIPRGPVPDVENTPFDFLTARPLSERFNQTTGICGPNCTGWDSCWVQSSPDLAKPAIEMYSPQSGIKVSVVSDQPAIQVYTCSGISGAKGSLPRKRSQGGDGTLAQIYENHSCIVLEMEEWIDGINHPEWNRTQVYAPEGKPYIWNADYTFSQVDQSGNAVSTNSTSTSSSAAASSTVASSTASATSSSA